MQDTYKNTDSWLIPIGYVSSLGSMGTDSDGVSPSLSSLGIMDSFTSFTVILGGVIGGVEFKGFIS